MNTKGFTIIETLVAITVLMIAISGPLAVVHNSLTAAIYARDKVVATYLAQDGLEYLKNKRDDNLIKNDSWLTGINDDHGGNICDETDAQSCFVDTTDSFVGDASNQPCGNVCGQLYYDTSNHNFVTRSPGTSGRITQFYRYYSLLKKADDEYRIQMTVKWKNGVISNSVSLKTTIFNVSR